MDKLLLTYDAPLLLPAPQKQKKSVLKTLAVIIKKLTFRIALFVIISICTLSALDMIDSTLTNAMMRGVYSVADFFAPDLYLFDDDTHLGFVAKLLQTDFRYIESCSGVCHIVQCDFDIKEGILTYHANGVGRILCPADCIVKSVDNVANATYVSLSIGEDMVYCMELDMPVGLSAGQYVLRGSLIGSYAGTHEIKVGIYHKGQLITHPTEDKRVQWVSQ